MAGKKAKKKAMAMPMKAEKDECACCSETGTPLAEWLLVFVGALGLAYGLGYVNWPIFTQSFPVIWPVLVIVVAVTNIANRRNCSC